MLACPCCSGSNYQECCEAIVSGDKLASNPISLVRARYTAFVMKKLDFVDKTHAPEIRDDFNRAEAESLADQCKWHSLHIHDSRAVNSDTSEVDFVVRLWKDEKIIPRGSTSTFRLDNDRWLLVSSKSSQHLAHMKTLNIGRNDPCLCNSQKKFKKCCANKPEYAHL